MNKQVTPILPITKPHIAKVVVLEALRERGIKIKKETHIWLAYKISRVFNKKPLKIRLDRATAGRILVFFANKLYE